jgi:hypothetical protein
MHGMFHHQAQKRCCKGSTMFRDKWRSAEWFQEVASTFELEYHALPWYFILISGFEATTTIFLPLNNTPKPSTYGTCR